jgi:hypothetical protein
VNGDGRGDGFVATADAGILGLKLTGVYGSKKRNNADNQYFVGVKGDASILPGFTGSAFYLTEEEDTLRTANVGRDVYGLSASGKLFGLLSLEGEYSVSKPHTTLTNDANAVGYVKAGLDLGAFTVGGNYRTLDAAWDGLGGDGDYVYKLNQTGFGADVAINSLFNFLSVSFKYDQRSNKFATSKMGNGPLSDTDGTGLGAYSETDIRVIGGIRLIGFDVQGLFYSDTETEAVGTGTAFGARALHDGSKADALLKGLNLGIGYGSGSGAKYDGSGFYVYADTSLDLGGFNIKPKGYFTSGKVGANDVNSLGFGLNLSAALFGAKLTGGVGYDASGLGTVKATTLWYTVGLAFDSFLLPNSSFSVAYASRDDVNRTGTKFGPSWSTISGDSITPFKDIAQGWGSIVNAAGGTEQGLYFTLGYYGLQFNYGIFTLDDDVLAGNAISVGQAFKISYKLKF